MTPSSPPFLPPTFPLPFLLHVGTLAVLALELVSSVLKWEPGPLVSPLSSEAHLRWLYPSPYQGIVFIRSLENRTQWN